MVWHCHIGKIRLMQLKYVNDNIILRSCFIVEKIFYKTDSPLPLITITSTPEMSVGNLSLQCLCVTPVSLCPSCVFVSILCLCVPVLSFCPSCVSVSPLCLCVPAVSLCPCCVFMSLLCLCVPAVYLCPCCVFVSPCLCVCLCICPS